jgi:hypothetical protein
MVGEFGGYTELKFSGTELVEPNIFGSFRMYSVQKEFIEKDTDDLAVRFSDCLFGDVILNRVAGPEQVVQLAYYQPAYHWVGDTIMALVGRAEREHVIRSCEGIVEDVEPVGGDDAENDARAVRVAAMIEARYRKLSPEERTVIMHLYAMSKSVLMPLALVSGACNEAEYALGVMAGHATLGGVFSDVSAKEHKNAFDEIRAQARTGMDYIHYYRAG